MVGAIFLSPHLICIQTNSSVTDTMSTVFFVSPVTAKPSDPQLTDFPDVTKGTRFRLSGLLGNQGCHGGLMTNAYKYIISNGGITTETEFVYSSGTLGWAVAWEQRVPGSSPACCRSYSPTASLKSFLNMSLNIH